MFLGSGKRVSLRKVGASIERRQKYRCLLGSCSRGCPGKKKFLRLTMSPFRDYQCDKHEWLIEIINLGCSNIQWRPRIDIARTGSWLRSRDLDFTDTGEARASSRPCSQTSRGRFAGQTDRWVSCRNKAHVGAYPEERWKDSIGHNRSQRWQRKKIIGY